MKDRLAQITEKTALPIGLVIVLIGGINWLTALHYEQVAMAEKITLGQRRSAIIDYRLQRIEQKLNIPPLRPQEVPLVD